jgi:hypothetical protein
MSREANLIGEPFEMTPGSDPNGRGRMDAGCV